MVQGYWGVKWIFQECSRNVIGMLKGCYRGITEVFQGCYVVLFKYYRYLAGVLHGWRNSI